MSSEKSKEELFDIFGGNASKKVEPLDEVYNFEDDDDDVDETPTDDLSGVDPESDIIEVLDADDEAEVDVILDDSAELDDLDAGDGVDLTGEEQTESEDDCELEGGSDIGSGAAAEDSAESHWDSLAAELGLVDETPRPTVRRTRKPAKVKTPEPVAEADSGSDEGADILDELFVPRDQKQFEAPKQPSYFGKDAKLDVEADATSEEAELKLQPEEDVEGVVEFEVEDFADGQASEISRPARRRRGESGTKPARSGRGSRARDNDTKESSDEVRGDRGSRRREKSADDRSRKKERGRSDSGEEGKQESRRRGGAERDSDSRSESRGRGNRNRDDGGRSRKESVRSRSDSDRSERRESESRGNARRRDRDRDVEGRDDRRERNERRDEKREREPVRGRDRDRSEYQDDSGDRGKRKSRQRAPESDEADSGKRRIPTWNETINDLIDHNLSSRKPAGGRGRSGGRSKGNRSGGNGDSNRSGGGSRRGRRQGGSDDNRRR